MSKKSRHSASKTSYNDVKNEDRVEYLTGILDLEFEVLHVNQARANTVIAINAGLIAAVVWIFQSYIGSNKIVISLLLGAMLLCVFSLFMGLCFTFPRIDSKIGNGNNLRGIVGICKLNKEEYYLRIKDLSYEEMLKQLSFQISGMARNNKRDIRCLVCGIMLLMVAIVLFTASVVIWLLDYVL